jgi:hypothetical protein
LTDATATAPDPTVATSRPDLASTTALSLPRVAAAAVICLVMPLAEEPPTRVLQ